MYKNLSFILFGLALSIMTLPCEATKLTRSQMEEIYNSRNAASDTKATSAKTEPRVSTHRVLKPNASIKNSTNSVPKPNVEKNVIQKRTTPTVATINQASKANPSSDAKSTTISKSVAIKKTSAEQALAQKEVRKSQNYRTDKTKKGTNKTTRTNDSKSSISSWRIKIAQRDLRILGFSNEPSTGKITAITKDALIAFQKKHKLTAKGELNDETYSKLNWEAFSKTGIKNINGSDIVAKAAKYKGVPYVFGGTTPKGFDCSGYVQYVFKQLGGTLTRTADTQAEEGIFVTQKQLKPGDLVFFTTYEPGASHVGIYAGNGQFWNASSSRGVVLYKLSDDYWRSRYYGARRVLVSNGEIN